jgi:hypothetical protein
MSDREMLEDAAKAAGIDVRWYQGDCLRVADKCNGFAGKWNPLTDDGDALRLAVELRIGSVHALLQWSEENHEDAEAAWENDPNAATRRAIVRAAAEIGRGIAQQTARADLPEDNYYKTMAEAEETGRTAAEIGRQMP